MNNAPRPVAGSDETLSFDLSPNAHRIASDEEALAVAHQLSHEFAAQAAERDRERRLPVKELDRFSGSGLWGITVPKAYGGAGVSFATLAEVVAVISAADPNLGQLPQNHLAALDAIRVTASEEQKQLWFGRALQGYRLGNAFSEAKSKHVGAFRPRCGVKAISSWSTGRSSMRPALCSRISSILARLPKMGKSIWRSLRATHRA